LFKLAHLLGFKNFSEYQLSLLCAKNPENVESFLNKLTEKMRLLQKIEMDLLLKYKKDEVRIHRIKKNSNNRVILHFCAILAICNCSKRTRNALFANIRQLERL
jgi:hypothetical protein